MFFEYGHNLGWLSDPVALFRESTKRWGVLPEYRVGNFPDIVCLSEPVGSFIFFLLLKSMSFVEEKVSFGLIVGEVFD